MAEEAMVRALEQSYAQQEGGKARSRWRANISDRITSSIVGVAGNKFTFALLARTRDLHLFSLTAAQATHTVYRARIFRGFPQPG